MVYNNSIYNSCLCFTIYNCNHLQDRDHRLSFTSSLDFNHPLAWHLRMGVVGWGTLHPFPLRVNTVLGVTCPIIIFLHFQVVLDLPGIYSHDPAFKIIHMHVY